MVARRRRERLFLPSIVAIASVVLGLAAVVGLRAIAVTTLLKIKVGELGDEDPGPTGPGFWFHVVWALSMLCVFVPVAALVARWAKEERPRALRYAAAGVAGLALLCVPGGGTQLADGAALIVSAGLLWCWSYRASLGSRPDAGLEHAS